MPPRVSQRLIFGMVLVAAAVSSFAEARAGDPSWTGRTKYRLLVEVPAVELQNRQQDIAVASVTVDFTTLLDNRQIKGQFDPSSLHVHRYDPDTGRAYQFSDGRFATDPHDCPCRFDDELSPLSDLSRVGSAIDSRNGLVRSTKTPRKARLFNREPA